MTRSVALLLIAILCFAIALILEQQVLTGSDWQAWTIGGFIAWALSQLPLPPLNR